MKSPKDTGAVAPEAPALTLYDRLGRMPTAEEVRAEHHLPDPNAPAPEAPEAAPAVVPPATQDAEESEG